MLNLLSFKPQDPAASLPPCHPICSNRSLHVGDVAVVDELVVGGVVDGQHLDNVVDKQLHIDNIKVEKLKEVM